MFKIFTKLLFLILLGSTLFASNHDLVANRDKLQLYNVDTGELENMKDKLKGHFTILWYYDDRCPYTINSLPELKVFLKYIEEKYDSNDLQFIFVEALHRYSQEIDAFRTHFGLDNYEFYMSPNMEMNTYMNVTSTPTLILVDPFLNIVDKIRSQTIAPLYVKHIDYVMGKFYKAMGYDSSYYEGLINQSLHTILKKLEPFGGHNLKIDMKTFNTINEDDYSPNN